MLRPVSNVDFNLCFLSNTPVSVHTVCVSVHSSCSLGHQVVMFSGLCSGEHSEHKVLDTKLGDKAVINVGSFIGTTTSTKKITLLRREPIDQCCSDDVWIVWMSDNVYVERMRAVVCWLSVGKYKVLIWEIFPYLNMNHM